jgi:hypothetical protein
VQPQILRSQPRRRKSLATACRPCCPTLRSAIFHSSPRRGGRDLNNISRSFRYGADGVVIKFHRILLKLNTTPSARAKDASRRFLDGAASPPQRGGENPPLHHLTNSACWPWLEQEKLHCIDWKQLYLVNGSDRYTEAFIVHAASFGVSVKP